MNACATIQSRRFPMPSLHRPSAFRFLAGDHVQIGPDLPDVLSDRLGDGLMDRTGIALAVDDVRNAHRRLIDCPGDCRLVQARLMNGVPDLQGGHSAFSVHDHGHAPFFGWVVTGI